MYQTARRHTAEGLPLDWYACLYHKPLTVKGWFRAKNLHIEYVVSNSTSQYCDFQTVYRGKPEFCVGLSGVLHIVFVLELVNIILVFCNCSWHFVLSMFVHSRLCV
jgi:hypothetical protein